MSLELRKQWCEAQARMTWLKSGLAENTVYANNDVAIALARAIVAEAEYIKVAERMLVEFYGGEATGESDE